ncbi:MAG: folate family ECF transporter S component [Clostridiales Family XIII bacterium]|jgi:ECF transporter S component (folate family)|nr:folate family ECF transporter S component [Clostridiales Family XIII bacterium]
MSDSRLDESGGGPILSGDRDQRGPSAREFFSAKGVFTTRNVVVMAVLLGIRTILNLPFLTIYLGPNFKLITFSYICDALTSMFFGPIAGILFAFAGDTLGFFALSGAGGAYFPGFALSEAVTCFIFACFFYKRRVTLRRVIAAWLINLGVVLLGMNSLWLILMYGMEAGKVFTFARVISNVVQSPAHIAILFFLLTRIATLEKKLGKR